MDLENVGTMRETINPQNISKADIAVFILSCNSCNEAEHIDLVVKKASTGLKKFFPDFTAVMVNCDTASPIGTKEAFFAAECETPRIYIPQARGDNGRGGNLRNAFAMASELSSKAVALLDANLVSIKTTWIKSLVDPIINRSIEYVSPLYVRQKLDAPLTNGLVYPMMRALFGRRVFQPISIDHAFSGRVNQLFLKNNWDDDDRGYRADMKMLYTVINNQIPICQSFMAHPRLSALDQLDQGLSKTFGYTIKSLFDLMIETSGFWKSVKRSRPTILAGVDESPQNHAPLAHIDRGQILDNFIDLGESAQRAWRQYLSPALACELTSMLNQAENGSVPVLEPNLWRQIIFDSALVYKDVDSKSRLDLAVALAPVFLLKILTISILSEDMSESQYRNYMESEALCFEQGKKDLAEAWH